MVDDTSGDPTKERPRVIAPAGVSNGRSLRTILAGTLALFAALILIGAGALALVTQYLHRDARDLGSAVDGVHQAQELGLQLTTHNRVSNYLIVNAPAYGPSPADVETRLRERLAGVARYAKTPEERSLVDDVKRALEIYLVAQRDAQMSRTPLADRIVETRPALDGAFNAIDALIDHAVGESRRSRERAREADILADALSLGMALIGLLGVAGAMYGLQRHVYRPLDEIQAALGRFGEGDWSARALDTGPSELRRTARVFNSMADGLAMREQRQRVFLGGIAHDLRTPLAAIQMSVTRLVVPGAPRSEEAFRRTIALVNRQIGALARIIDDFLDFTRIQAGKLDLRFERRDLRELVSDATELYGSLSVRHRFEVSVPPQPVVASCDVTRIVQVLNNLLSNAVKYSPEGGDVRVTLSEENNEAVIVVMDEGIGIDPDEMGHIFEPYRRTRASREMVPGVGLGLSVLRRIVEGHGGRVEVESVPASGTTFRVGIPLADAAPSFSATGPTPRSSRGVHF